MAKRKRTPQDIETEVLSKSARRCCICFMLQMDLSVKKGQIAHLDGNPGNSLPDNLAYLCMPHHDEYDTVTRQSKGFTIHEVKSYRTLLYEAIRQARSEMQSSGEMSNTANELESGLEKEISDVLSKIQSRTVLLSQCLAESISLAQKIGSSSLEAFCRKELTGYSDKDSPYPVYRVLDVFISTTARININYAFWLESNSTIFEYLRQHTESFSPYRMRFVNAIPEMEAQVAKIDTNKTVIQVSSPARVLNPEAENPEQQIFIYIHPSEYLSVLEGVRRELTVYLLDLMPAMLQE